MSGALSPTTYSRRGSNSLLGRFRGSPSVPFGSMQAKSAIWLCWVGSGHSGFSNVLGTTVQILGLPDTSTIAREIGIGDERVVEPNAFDIRTDHRPALAKIDRCTVIGR